MDVSVHITVPDFNIMFHLQTHLLYCDDITAVINNDLNHRNQRTFTVVRAAFLDSSQESKFISRS